MPKVYDALNVENLGLTLEVQQQLGDGVVRAIAMGSAEGLTRGAEASNTGAPISVPVGTATLGRIMDVLGTPIDEKGDIGENHVCRFTVKHRLSQSRLLQQKFWKPVLRLSTWSLPREGW